ncbi:MAG TPA: type II 3-dehydroquinate dehydratase [Actinomycetota bacterium]|nr:type II 3-dehydroquinate dehydratase [Actinomycetota bacterium]
MRLLVLHGPNLNLLGTRRPDLYGTATLEQIDRMLSDAAQAAGHDIDSAQSNHEGELIDRLHAARSHFDGVLLNPGGLGHTSVALRDAVEACGVPVAEVHLSNIYAREDYRRRSIVAEACAGVVSGFGPQSYVAAMWALLGVLQAGDTTTPAP